MGRYRWVSEAEDRDYRDSECSIRNSDRSISPEEVLGLKRIPVVAILDNIRSAYNVGSIFRTSDSVRLEMLYLCGMTAFPPNDKLEKTSLGSVRYVPWEYHKDSLMVIKSMKKQGLLVASFETTDRSVDFFTFDCPAPLCMVLGHEVNGVSPEILRESDVLLEVPTMGVKNSLNVATLFGIAVYEILRQYRVKKIV
jgi:tRNA G18 (ribose-2'-O)-methylase SpoU